MRGFAAGLLFAAIVIAIYYYIEENKQPDMTFDELKQAGQEMGYELVSKEMPDEEEKLPEKTVATDVSTNETSDVSQVQTFQLQITDGMGSDDIALILFEKGIIENTDQFETFLKDHDLTKKIQIGAFQLTAGMSFKEISDIITKTP